MTSEADRRSAHRRVGTAAVLAFLALLLLGATRGPAQASPTVPAATPQPGYEAPGHAPPPDRDDDGDGFGPRDGFGGHDHDGGGGFEGGDTAPAPPSGNQTAPAPSTGGSQT